MHFVKLATPSGIGKRLEQSRPCPWGFWTWRREVEKGKPMGHHVEAKDLGKRQQRRNRGTAGDFGRVWKRRRTKPVVSKRWTRRSKERKDNCTGDVSGMGNCWRNYHSVPNRVLGLEEDCWVALKKIVSPASLCMPAPWETTRSIPLQCIYAWHIPVVKRAGDVRKPPSFVAWMHTCGQGSFAHESMLWRSPQPVWAVLCEVTTVQMLVFLRWSFLISFLVFWSLKLWTKETSFSL